MMKNDSSTEIDEPRKEMRTVFWLFHVNPKVSHVNFFSFLVAVFAAIALIVFLSAGQSSILYFLGENNKQNSHGNTTGSLALYDELLAIVMVIVWGPLSDRIGRRPVYSFAFFLVGLSVALYPLAKNVYPQLLLLRLLFSVGTSGTTSMMTAMLGDILVESGGRVSGITGLCSGLGAVFSAFFLMDVPTKLYKVAHRDELLAVQYGFGIIGGCTMFVALVFFFTLPRVNEEGSGFGIRFKKGNYSELLPSKHFKHLLKGFKAGKDPRVALGFATSFVARADTVIFSTFVALWVQQYFSDLGQAEVLTGMAQTWSLIAAPFYGIMSEHMNKAIVTSIGGVIGAIGCLPFAFTLSPYNKINLVWACFIGVGQIGMIITGMAIVNGPYVRPEIRGSVASAYSFFGAVAIVIVSKLGGYLFDVWMYGAPFLLLGICHVLISIAGITVTFTSRCINAKFSPELIHHPLRGERKPKMDVESKNIDYKQ
ncbi:MFS general substrate transporter [Basidiobolus meristosporus CBS 931.73]|uniref:MFS general substrate transporter n=1 Tax=Basidiobolus meristosporus CBS 931.73 TaxID=1314790 RepID=A0A1Y1Z4L0_9FUNG|nr:MFS general substrate transporter [Basidiobolus meristosporus CBS 931.73]|eukprot:ORY05136.1 MFS general substrate transporter [Basidiobolus meristosporus CBS 931.73]